MEKTTYSVDNLDSRGIERTQAPLETLAAADHHFLRLEELKIDKVNADFVKIPLSLQHRQEK